MTWPDGTRCVHCGRACEPEARFCPRDGTPLGEESAVPRPDPYLGIELAGRIAIRSFVGAGSMGRVYQAFQGGIERDVAVKILRRELASDASLVARFHREAKIASRLTHPGIVQVLMSGTLPPDEARGSGGDLYLVMEYLRGVSLQALLAHHQAETGSRALPLARAIDIVLQICDAVAEAHAQGIIHRDIKPENIMLVARGGDRELAKVLDFGIARLLDDRSVWTEAGLVLGSAPYVSPEGAQGEAVGPAADVYAIATVLYECLAGRTPFCDQPPVRLILQQALDAPPPLGSLAAARDVPAELAAVVMQNLAKDPHKRARDARELGRELYAALKRAGVEVDGVPSAFTRSSPLRAPPPSEAAPVEPSSRTVFAGTPASLEDMPATTETAPSVLEPHEPPPESGPRSPPRRSSLAPVADEPTLESLALPADEPTEPEDETFADGPDSGPPESGPRRSRPPPASPSRPSQPTPIDEPAPPASLPSTSLVLERRHGARRTVLAGLIALSLVVLGLVALQRAGGEDEVAAAAAEVRALIEAHAWDAPEPRNVRAMLADLAARHPADPRVRALRREAAERLVAEALALRYAGQRMQAVARLRTAIAIAPEVEVARRLLEELEP